MVSQARINLGGSTGVEAVSRDQLRVGFRAAYVIEVVEEGNPDALHTHVFPLNPQGYVLTEPFTSVLTPGEGDGVVAEENGTIIREIQLTGTPGFAVKTSASFQSTTGQEIGGVRKSGNDHFLALRNLFRAYSELKKDPARGPKVEMVFHSLKDDDHFVVVPRQFETPRDSRSTRVHYEYRITLAAIALSDRRVKKQGDPFGLDNPLQVIGEAFHDARSFFAELTADLSTLKRQVGNIQAVMINVTGFLNAVGNFVRGAASVIEFGLQSAVNIIDQLDSAADELIYATQDSTLGTFESSVRNMRKLTQALQRIAAFGQRFENSANDHIDRIRTLFAGEKRLTEEDLRNNTAGATNTSATRIARGSEGHGVDYPSFVGVRTIIITHADTIISLSVRYGVPSALIVIINNLVFPYITPGGGPGLLKPGDRILIPVSESSSEDADATLSSSADYITPEEALYGSDFALDTDLYEREQKFDILVDEAHGSEDAAVVRGLPNLIQGVRILIDTERGSTVYIPDLGIRRTVGVKGTIRHLVLAALNLRTAILQDPRIVDIEDSQVVLEGDVVQQEITPVIRGQRDRVTLVRPIGSASGV